MRKRVIGIIAAVAGATLLITGLAIGEAGTVLQRAIMVCLECIGIG